MCLANAFLGSYWKVARRQLVLCSDTLAIFWVLLGRNKHITKHKAQTHVHKDSKELRVWIGTQICNCYRGREFKSLCHDSSARRRIGTKLGGKLQPGGSRTHLWRFWPGGEFKPRRDHPERRNQSDAATLLCPTTIDAPHVAYLCSVCSATRQSDSPSEDCQLVFMPAYQSARPRHSYREDRGSILVYRLYVTLVYEFQSAF